MGRKWKNGAIWGKMGKLGGGKRGLNVDVRFLCYFVLLNSFLLRSRTSSKLVGDGHGYCVVPSRLLATMEHGAVDCRLRRCGFNSWCTRIFAQFPPFSPISPHLAPFFQFPHFSCGASRVRLRVQHQKFCRGHPSPAPPAQVPHLGGGGGVIYGRSRGLCLARASGCVPLHDSCTLVGVPPAGCLRVALFVTERYLWSFRPLTSHYLPALVLIASCAHVH